jgi:glucokinase
LSGDIGGTKTRLALYDVEGARLESLAEVRYPSREHASLDEILRVFLDTNKMRCDYACFGIAGPVKGGRVDTTNLSWRVDAAQLAVAHGFKAVWLLNDLEASAWGIGALQARDLHVLNVGQADAQGNALIISAGTGLGQAGMFWDGERHRPFASEGGHADFAPGSEIEIALLRHLLRRYGHVSWERLISGMGLVNIHEFLGAYRDMETPPWLARAMQGGDRAAEISRAAQEGRCPLCAEALDLFVRLYGAEAGNHALKIMARGGVYIGGGIAPKILGRLEQGAFLEAFWAKGRMEPLLREMPVKVILNEKIALYGPALYAAWRVRHP